MAEAISIQNLQKTYDSSFQLGPVSLSIPGGIIAGLIGENGAGKTTLIKSLLGIIRPDSGQISVFGRDMNRDEAQCKEDIGLVLDNMFFPELLTPRDIASSLRSIYKNWDDALFCQYLKDFSLPDNKPIKTFSKGMRKKLEISAALAHHPKLLILDEPTSGLDPVVRSEVMNIFLQFICDEAHSILFSTHITSDLEHCADQILFMDGGQLVLNKSRDDILDGYGILKCDEQQFALIDREDMLSYRKNKYNIEVLVSDRTAMARKYPDCVMDAITLEDLMILMIKGEKPCQVC